MSTPLEGPVTFLVWKTPRPTINELNELMVEFPTSVFVVSKFHCLTKQFKNTEDGSPTDLLKVLFCCVDEKEMKNFMKPTGDVEVERVDGADKVEEEVSEEKACCDERAVYMEYKNVTVFQARFENKTTTKCVDLLKSVDDNDCIADVETVNYE